ncbi:hypothetical protein [Pollutibacter soli]|uniref:hypothetical protein n=1 Tax=Pollutibacter soli TaxID=3034157 RepID=UPI003013F959
MKGKYLVWLLCIWALFSCRKGSSHFINHTQVSHIEIRKQADPIPLRLTEKQTYLFLQNWNNSKLKGVQTIDPEFHLNIYLQNDSLIRLQVQQHLISHPDEYVYSFGDKSFFRRIWYDCANIPHDYLEYTPLVKDKKGFKKAHHVLTDKHRDAIKKVLSHHSHHWKDVRGQIFYKGSIKEEILFNYTSLAEDSSWLAKIEKSSSTDTME